MSSLLVCKIMMVVAGRMQVKITPLARSSLVYLFPHLDYRPEPSMAANTLASSDNPANMGGKTHRRCWLISAILAHRTHTDAHRAPIGGRPTIHLSVRLSDGLARHSGAS